MNASKLSRIPDVDFNVLVVRADVFDVQRIRIANFQVSVFSDRNKILSCNTVGDFDFDAVVGIFQPQNKVASRQPV